MRLKSKSKHHLRDDDKKESPAAVKSTDPDESKVISDGYFSLASEWL